MLYSNPEFFLLFGVTLALFLWLESYRARFALLLAASLVFYAWAGLFDFAVYLFVVTVSWTAVALARRHPARKSGLLTAGITIMALHLFFWKYASWAASQVQLLWPSFLGGRTLSLPLPIGISFFTLQGIAYLADFSHDDAEYMALPTYLLFKSFFAQLVAGPIVRASQLLPQLRRLERPSPRLLSAGLSLFVYGFFKKLVVADGVTPFVDPVFANPSRYGRGALLLALLGYTAQIWADFSGYTDMGRGAAKMLGIELPENFLSPYLSRSPSEFWRRWHITLSEWIRDYVFTPLALGGSLGVFTCMIVSMGLCGLWHGAQWHYVAWGLYHGLLLVAQRRLSWDWGWTRLSSRALDLLHGAATLSAVVFGWLIFRAEGFSAIGAFLRGLLRGGGGAAPSGAGAVLLSLAFCAMAQWLPYYDLETETHPIADRLSGWAARRGLLGDGGALERPVAGFGLGAALAAALVAAIVLRQTNMRAFIYFQF